MPLIEELPITQSHRVTHGWAYVPDTGPHAIAAVQPGSRKRGRDAAASASTKANATAKQQKAVQARLDSLDKENYKDGVAVPIPAKATERKRDNGRKMTANVRRILTYQRGFAHYLADEQANAGTTTTTVTTAATATIGQGAGVPAQPHTAAGRGDGRRKSNVVETPIPTPTPARRGRPPTRDKNKDKMMPPPTPTPVKHELSEKDSDTTMTDAPPTTSTPVPKPTPPPVPSQSTYDPSLDKHPLLRTTGLPKMPSDRVMAVLLAEPPLSYTAARARPLDPDLQKPTRRFCGVCGYWGKVKCRRCGDWTCGIMECWKGHEAVCVAVGMY